MKKKREKISYFLRRNAFTPCMDTSSVEPLILPPKILQKFSHFCATVVGTPYFIFFCFFVLRKEQKHEFLGQVMCFKETRVDTSWANVCFVPVEICSMYSEFFPERISKIIRRISRFVLFSSNYTVTYVFRFSIRNYYKTRTRADANVYRN